MIPIIGNLWNDIFTTKKFETPLEHGKHYEFLFTYTGSMTPDKYISIEKTLIEKMPDVVFEKVDVNTDSKVVSVKIYYASPVIPLLAYGIGILIVSAVGLIGLHLVMKDFKEVAPKAITQPILAFVLLIVVFVVGYIIIFRGGKV